MYLLLISIYIEASTLKKYVMRSIQYLDNSYISLFLISINIMDHSLGRHWYISYTDYPSLGARIIFV